MNPRLYLLRNICAARLHSRASFSTTKSIRQQGTNSSKIKKTTKAVQKLFSPVREVNADKTRNVGIIAHIDAGKTTATEQFLYYSGITDDVGRVDEGSTITDYLAQERERGITIQSAAISLHWRQHRVNIIDTPGHIDFTMEVERVLRVMDSAVGILDASAGVEAQTKTVWKQANKFHLPRVVFLNKMDKRGANVQKCLDSMREDLGVIPLLTQYNLGLERDFEGVVDLLTMHKMRWSRGQTSKEFVKSPFSRSEDVELYERCVLLRHRLIDALAELSPSMMDVVMNGSTYDYISAEAIAHSLRDVTCSSKAVPVLMGSALKNCAIQPLLDAVVDYLPGPEENNSKFAFDNRLCAFAFKTVHQKERGRVTFLRLYNGKLTGSSKIYNASKDHSDHVGQLYTILADQMMETKSAHAGDIVAVTGLDKTVTGDSLLENARTVTKYEEEGVLLPSLDVPDPVFMCSIEPYSTKDQRALDMALAILMREDPSLRVKADADTGQLIVSGMGDLHLEIVKDRLLREHKLEVYLGNLLVAYREAIETPSDIIHHTLERALGETIHHVSLSVSVEPTSSPSKYAQFVQSSEERWNNLRWFHRKPINQGAEAALLSGPLLGYPVLGCRVKIHTFTLHSRRTSAAMISAAVTEAVHQALNNSGIMLNEPVMSLQIYCDDDHLGDILEDLARRRAVVEEVVHNVDGVTVNASSPVATLLGYSTKLRTLTSGRAHFQMEIEGYVTMTEHERQRVITEVRGY